MASNLTSSAQILAYFGGSHNFSDDRVTFAVNSANDSIERYCDRTFAATSYHKWVYLNGDDTISLDEYPLVTLRRLCSGTQYALSLDLDSSALAGQVSIVEGILNVTQIASGSDVVTATFTLSDYATMTLLATAINDDETLTLWSAAVENEGSPSSIMPMITDEAEGATVYLEQPEDGTTSYRLEPGAGLVKFGLPRNGWFYVNYYAGYASIPADLSQIATEMAASILQGTSRDATLESEKIGDYSYKTKAVSDVVSSFEPRLDKWRRRAL